MNKIYVENEKNEIPGSRNISRIMSIDYLKAIAIVLVIITHICSKEMELRIGAPFWINMAVPVLMIISGFTYSMSADRNGISSLGQYFDRKQMVSKLSRLAVPYFIAITLEILIYVMVKPLSFKEIVIGYCTGGWGPGSYYFPILIQLLLLFPGMYLLFRKFPLVTIILSFALHLCFDFVSEISSIEVGLYRLSIFRYLVFIVMGISLYFYKYKLMKRKFLLVALAVGSLIYIWMCQYYGYVPVIFSKWKSTSLPTVFWALLLVILGMKYLEIENKNWFTNVACVFGKSSYHIYLAQMIYFNFDLGKSVILTPVHITLCCLAGIAFYYLEANLKKSVKRKRPKAGIALQ